MSDRSTEGGLKPPSAGLDPLLKSLRAQYGGKCAGGCGSAPEAGGLYCAQCEARAQRERAERARAVDRHEREAIARETLGQVVAMAPAWDHARFGSEVYVRLDRDLRRWVESYQPEEHGSICLLGPSGAGKTTAVRTWLRLVCARAFRAVMDRGLRAPEFRFARRILWTTGHAVASARRQHSLGEGDAPLLERARAATLLIVDECGSEPPDAALFETIDARYARGAATVLTSGLGREAFVRRYGDALFRRLTDDGVGSVIDLSREA